MDKHVEALEALLADAGEPDLRISDEECEALRAAIALMRGQSEVSRDKQADQLARRCLWIAFVWNDHNFGHPHEYALAEAERCGITNFDQANAWIEAINAPPKDTADEQ